MDVKGQFVTNMCSVFVVILLLVSQVSGLGEIIWAVNCGGDAHTDANGIRFQRDVLTTGIASDYGRSLMIQRAVPQDQILYQTERYHTATFGYDVPVKGDGEYVLVLKFSEVWFTSPNQKVFDIQLNGEHTVIDGLDIFAKVGRGTAHDEFIPFTIRGGELRVGGEKSLLDSGKLTIEFVKGESDNPKINALYLMKGSMEEAPQLPPLPGLDRRNGNVEEEDEDEEGEEIDAPARKTRRPSGPKVADPYASDDTGSMMLPVFMAVGLFVPLLFCLCKL